MKSKWTHVKTTWDKIRAKVPFAEAGFRPFWDDTIPELDHVAESVLQYQRSRDFFYSKYYLKTFDRADYYGAPAPLRVFTWRFMKALRARGLPFYVHTCWRSPDDQQKLKSDGFSQVARSPHQKSCAVDIVSAVDHWEIPETLWYYVGTLGESVAKSTPFPSGVSMEWGGRWKFFDPAHWQLSDWRQRPAVDWPHEPKRLSPYSDEMRF